MKNSHLLVLPITLALAPAHAQVWQDLGPAPIAGGATGRVSAVVCSRTNPNLYYELTSS